MNLITEYLKKQKTRIFTSFVAILLLFTSITVMDDASAAVPVRKAQAVTTPATEIKVSPDPAKIKQLEQSTQESQDAFQRVITQTQSSFEKVLAETKQIISDLPQQLEQVSTQTDATVRKQIKNDLEDKQDDLENAADTVDDLAEKIQKFNKKLQSSLEKSQVTVSSEFQNNAQKAQLSLENAAKSLESLADDTERAKKNSSPAFRDQIDKQIKTVNQDLEEATQAIKAFKPA